MVGGCYEVLHRLASGGYEACGRAVATKLAVERWLRSLRSSGGYEACGRVVATKLALGYLSITATV